MREDTRTAALSCFRFVRRFAPHCSECIPLREKKQGSVVSPVRAREARSEPLNVLLCQTHVRRRVIRRPFLGSRRSVESEPPRTPSAIMKCCSNIACSSLRVAGRVSRTLKVSGHDLWSCSESRGDPTDSTHHPAAQPQSRSTLIAHARARADATGNAEEDVSARTSVSYQLRAWRA